MHGLAQSIKTQSKTLHNSSQIECLLDETPAWLHGQEYRNCVSTSLFGGIAGVPGTYKLQTVMDS